MMPVQDLRTVLEERAAAAPDQPADRLSAAYRRAASIRRRRRAGAVGAAAGLAGLVLAGATLLSPDAPTGPGPAPAGSGTSAPRPATEADLIAAIANTPEQLHGGDLALRVTLTPGSASITTAPEPDLPDGDYFLTFTCTGRAHVEAWVNDLRLLTSDCTGGRTEVRWPSWQRPAVMARMGLRGDKDSSFALSTVGLRGDNAAVLGVYRMMPPARFPRPQRPATLIPPRRPAEFGEGGTSVGPGAGRTESAPDSGVSERLTRDLRVALTCTAPGDLTVYADGIPVAEHACWDYAGSTSISAPILTSLNEQPGPRRKAGDRVLLTVRATRFVEPETWRVDISP
jgi:hypothetical protein